MKETTKQKINILDAKSKEYLAKEQAQLFNKIIQRSLNWEAPKEEEIIYTYASELLKRHEERIMNATKDFLKLLGFGIMTAGIFITIYMNPTLRIGLIVFLLGLYCFMGIKIQIKIFGGSQ
jgi:hypothetical protein